MRKNKRFLAAAVAETVRYILIMFLASAFGLEDGSAQGRALFGYACIPQLLFAAGFLFLWIDHPRYAVFTPLLLAGKVSLALPGAELALSFFASLRGVAGLSLPVSAMPAVIAAGLLDLFSLACLLFPVGAPVAIAADTAAAAAGERPETSLKESE